VARLFADENFPLPVVIELRRLGHDAVTMEEADDPRVCATGLVDAG
jgi:hypothetical protein